MKETFLNKLRKKISILEESEIQDILKEYEGYIEEKMKKGVSEEEAVKSMGNVDELAKELLSAYKVKNPSDTITNTFQNIADEITSIFDKIVKTFSEKSGKDLVKFLIEILLIFVIIAACKIPFSILIQMGNGIFESFTGALFNPLSKIWELVLEFSYLIFAVLLFIRIFKNRYLDKEELVEEQMKKSTKAEKKENFVKEEGSNTETEEKIHGVVDELVKVFLVFCKIFASFLLIGAVGYLIGMAVVLGVSLYFLLLGVHYYGIYLVFLALFGFGIVSFFFLINFIFNRKNKAVLLLIISLICLVFLGAGVGMCTLEFANTTVTYNDHFEEEAREVINVEMQENYVLWKNAEEIQIDDSLENIIKIEFVYDKKYMTFSGTSEIINRDGFKIVSPDYNVKTFTYNKEMFDQFIEALKKKELHIPKIADAKINVYASQAVKEQLMENAKKYDYSAPVHIADLEEFCNELYENDIKIPEYCKDYVENL